VKVLHFYRTYFPDTQGGLEEAIRQICASTKIHGVESRILTLSKNPEPQIIQFPEADVYRARLDLDIASCSMGVEAFSMFKELEKWADVVHYHFPWPFADIVKLWARSKKPSILTYHSDIVRQRWLGLLYRPIMNRFLAGMTKIVATSPNYAETSPTLRKYKDHLMVIPLGLDERTYPPVKLELVNKVTAKYGNDFFLFVGVLREYKGLKFLLDACKSAPFTILIAGKGPQEILLKDQAYNLVLNNAHFLGYVSDEMKVVLLKLCRGIVLPSYLRSEAFGVALLEGAMSGKPLISTEIGTGTSYINIDGETGFVVPPENPVALRHALNILHANFDTAQWLGSNARRRYERYFAAQLMGDAYANLYGRIARTSTGKNADAALADSG